MSAESGFSCLPRPPTLGRQQGMWAWQGRGRCRDEVVRWPGADILSAMEGKDSGLGSERLGSNPIHICLLARPNVRQQTVSIVAQHQQQYLAHSRHLINTCAMNARLPH